MSVLMDRRKLIVGAGSTALLEGLRPSPAFGLDLGSVFGTVLGAVGVGLFPGAAAALGGFELVRLLGNAADLAGNANNLVAQTQQLETHIDTVLNQVSSTLATVQSFVQDCDNALHDIENLVQQLPGALVSAFNEVAARTAFARLRADSANMAGYLQSKGSILANRTQIQNLSEKIVNDISTVDALQQNMVQFVIQVIPGLTTWVQGYTSYNLLLAGEARGTNPWDHQVVSVIGLPRITALLNGIKQQRAAAADVDSRLPLDAGSVYTFDGTTFAKTSRTFAPKYGAGEIDSGNYYTIFPSGVTLPSAPAGAFQPSAFGIPSPGDFCFLGSNRNGVRVWWVALPPNLVPPTPPLSAEAVAAEQAATVYPRMIASTLKNGLALDQLTEGWQGFERVVKTNLVTGDRDMWTKLPILKT